MHIKSWMRAVGMRASSDYIENILVFLYSCLQKRLRGIIILYLFKQILFTIISLLFLSHKLRLKVYLDLMYVASHIIYRYFIYSLI